MPIMPPLSEAPLSTLLTWHREQQPLVRALAEPMVNEMTSALEMMQKFIDQQGSLNTKLLHQLTEFVSLAQNQGSALEVAEGSVVNLTRKIEVTTDRIDVLERRLFGKRSEKRPPKTPDARQGARNRRREKMTDAEKKADREKAVAKRQVKLDALRTVTHTVTVPVEFNEGRAMPSVTSTVYEWRPGELIRVLVTREQRAMAAGFIVTAPPVMQVVEGGCYGPAIYAKVCVDKCLNAMPIRRQERAFGRIRVPLPASTLCSLFHRASDVIEPIYKALRAHVSSSPHVQGDETPMPVLDEKSTRKGWMWVFATDDALLFEHSPTRGKTVPERILGGTQGTLTVDGYTAYNSVSGDLGRKRGGCWCHARRGLFEAKKHDEGFIVPVLTDIDELFYVEEVAKDSDMVGTAAHLALRAEKSQPAIGRIFAKLERYQANAVDGRASVTKAVRYILNQREPLQLFLSDAAVPIHNNLCERALRIVALLRKNSLFAGNDDAAQRYAQLLSVLATCQLHDVNPEKWLADVLLAVNIPGLIAQDLLPWNWKLGRGLTATAY